MVLPSDVVEQEEVEEKIERTKEEETEGEEGKVKEGAEEGPTAEELDQAVVVVPTPPDTGKNLFKMTITSDKPEINISLFINLL